MKNTRRIVAGVFAAALVLQSAALTAMPAFADDAAPEEALQTSGEELTPPDLSDIIGGETDSDTTETTPTEAPAEDAEAPAAPDLTDAANNTADTTNTPAASTSENKLTLSGGTAIPAELTQGDYLIVKGTVTSSAFNIKSVSVSVCDSSGNQLYGGSAEPDSKTYDLNKLDKYIEFNKLPYGTYTYRVIASDESKTNHVLAEQQFTVVGAQNAADTLTVSGGTSVPAELQQGAKVSVRGTLNSVATNITSVSVAIYDSSNNKISGGEAQPDAKTFDLSALDKDVAFDILAAGTYTYKVIASNGGNANYTVVTQEFRVIGNGETTAADALTVSGSTEIPATLKQGSPVNVKGTVTSASSAITYLTVGVYDADGNFITGKTIAPNTKTYDLRRLDSAVSFDTLKPGKYVYAVIASNAATSNYALVNQQFTVAGAGSEGEEASAQDTLTISGATTIPDSIEVGKSLSIGGIVTSASSNISSLTAGVYDASSNFVTGKTINPGAKSYDLKNLDSSITFNTLPAGTYTYTVTATNTGNSNYTLIDRKFTVGNAVAAANDKLTITNGTTIPENLAQGKALSIGGTVTSSSSNITALTAGVYDINGKFVTGRTIAPNAKSYDLSKLDRYISFNTLPAGKYVYAVIASNASTTNYALVNKQFTVGSGGSTTTNTSNDKLTITGGTTIPDTLAVGKAVSITGTVTSASSNITALTAGVYDSNGKFITGRSINPNAKSYNLKNLDSYIAFNTLPEGKYVYAVIASNSANKNYALVNKQFTVGNGGSSGTTSSTSDKLTITGGTTIPDTIAVGKAVSITGTVTSASSNITALTAGVYDSNGKFVTGKTINPNAKSYDLKNLDRYIAFNTLSEGTYTYAVIATNSANKNYALVNKKFTVGNGGSSGTTSNTSDKLTITGGTTIPDTIAVGKAVSITGTVTSASSNITALTAGVYDSNGKFVTGKTINPNAKSYDLKNLDRYIAFNTLSAGTYTYAVIATNSANKNYALVNKKFTVGSGSSTGTTTNNSSGGLSISGGTSIPSTLAQGKAVSIRGVVSSTSNMTALTAGVYDFNGKFVTGRTIAPNSRSYDLKNLDSYIAFNTLPAGKYTYAVIASNASTTNYALVNTSFTVGDGGSTGNTSSSDRISISGGTSIPGTVSKGQGVAVRGTLSSSSNITSVTVGVYNSSGKQVTGASATPNAKSYNLSQVDSQIRFDQLAAGTYTYKVIASNGSNSGYTVVNQSFTVK